MSQDALARFNVQLRATALAVHSKIRPHTSWSD